MSLSPVLRAVDDDMAAERQAIADEGKRMLEAAETAACIEAEREAAEQGIKAAAQDAARKYAETHADAVRVVMRAKAREGQDLTATRPADALAIDIIRRALDDVRNAPAARVEDAFSATSTDSEIAKGAAVVEAFKGSAQ